MRLTSLIVVLLSPFAIAWGQEEHQVGRYVAEIHMADLTVTAAGIDGGVSGFTTDRTPIYAQAVVKFDGAQQLTWEWVGITKPGTLTVSDSLGITFTASSDQVKYKDLAVDLNRVAPGRWGSSFYSILDYDDLMFDFHYESSEHTSDTTGRFSVPHGASRYPHLEIPFAWVENEIDSFGFYPRIQFVSLDELSAIVNWQASPRIPASLPVLDVSHYDYDDWTWRGRGHYEKSLLPTDPIEIEPFIAITQATLNSVGQRENAGTLTPDVRLRYTPTGDANNDGKVDFSDFLILSVNFGNEGESGEPPTWEDGDFDGDGKVTFADFLDLSERFSGVQAASVPEPSDGAFLLLGLVGWFSYGRSPRNGRDQTPDGKPVMRQFKSRSDCRPENDRRDLQKVMWRCLVANLTKCRRCRFRIGTYDAGPHFVRLTLTQPYLSDYTEC